MENQQPASQRIASPDGLHVGFVPGVTLTKWRRIWAERFRRTPLDTVEIARAEQRDALLAADRPLGMCFIRLPIERDGLHVIPLYEEQPVVVVPKDHPLADFEEVSLADLAGEPILPDPESPDAADRTAWAGGLWLCPQSVARTQSRKDLVARPLVDAEPTTIGLAWRVGDDNPLIEEFIGIVRGRTLNSSRTQSAREARTGDAGSSTGKKPQKRPAAPAAKAVPRARRGAPKKR